MWQQIFENQIPSKHHGTWLRWLLVAFSVLLVGATQSLWMPATSEFPHIPWFAWGCMVPHGVDLALLFGAALSLIAVSCTKSDSRRNRYALLTFAGAAVGLMLLDQHRTQPWAYQFVLVAIVLATASHRRSISHLRLLTVSIYVHSAISKCDYSFCTGLGRTFLVQLHDLVLGPLPAGALPWQTGAWPLLFPLGELLVAAGLIWPVSRRWALWGATGIHVLLLVILGPWGLGHSWGVLIWNVYFIAQNFVLFGGVSEVSVNPVAGESVIHEPAWRSRFVATFVITGAVLWPCTEPWGFCDLWPAWGLYAQHGEQLTVWVSEDALKKLPVEWQETAIRSLQNETLEWQLRPQHVSLKLTGAPLYPQNRFQLGVVLALARQSNIEQTAISAESFLPANRWTGARLSLQLQNLDDIQRVADQSWFNTQPRQ